MASYPYYSPSPPCNNTTSPTLLPPPPPPPPPSPPACNHTATPTLSPPPLPPPPPACACDKTTPTLPSPPPPPPSSHYSPPLVSLSPPPSSRSQPPPSPSHPSPPPPPPFYHSPPIHSPPAPPPRRSPPSPPPPSFYYPPPLLPPPSLPSPSLPPPSSFSPPLHSPPPPPRSSPPPPPFYYSPPQLPPPSSPPPPKPSTPSPSPLSPDPPPSSPWAPSASYILISPTPTPTPTPAPAPPLPGTAVLATFAALGCLFLISGLLSMAQKIWPQCQGDSEQGHKTSNDRSGTAKMSSDLPLEESVNEFPDTPKKPSVTDNADASQDEKKAESNEVGEESKDSKKKPHLPKTEKRSSRAKKSGDKQSGMRQGLTTGCRQVLNIGCCLDLNNEDKGAESGSGAHEEESDDRPGKSRINQSESDNRKAAQYGENEPDEGGEKSYESGKKSLQTKNHPGSRRRGEQKLSEISTALDGGLNFGGPNDANEDLKYPSNVDDEISHEHHSNPICNQSENDGIDVTQDVEQQSDAVKRRLTSLKETSFHKKKHSSRLTGNQNASIVGQVSNAASNVDLDEEVQSQDNAQDEEEVHESEPQKDYKELEVGGPKNDPRGRQARTRGRSREEPLNLNQRMSTGSGNDSSSAVVSLDDEEGKDEELDSFASARRGTKCHAPDFE